MEDKFVGTETALELIKNDALNLTNNGIQYTGDSRYETHYAAVRAGYTYKWTFASSNSAHPTVRLGFSEQIPAKNVACTFLQNKENIYTIYTYTYEATVDGYLSVSAFDNSFANTTLSLTEFLNGIIPSINVLSNRISMDELLIDKIKGLNLYYDVESLEENGNNIRMKQWTMVPHNNAEITIKCPKNMCVWFTLAISPYNMSSATTDYYGNGQTLRLNVGYSLYKAYFGYAVYMEDHYELTGDKLTLEDITEIVNNNEIYLSYKDETVIINNKDAEKDIRAFIGATGNAVIAHISDTHGDAIRYNNFLEMAKYLGVTCAIHTGDFVNNAVNDGHYYLLSGIKNYPDVSTLITVGNHDAQTTNQEEYERYYSHFTEAYDYMLAPSNVYYYKDYPDVSLRIICLNIYEERHIGMNCCISSTQINWLIDTLLSTPENYGVIIMEHATENFVSKNSNYGKFYESGFSSDWTNTHSNITGNPISKIIDAFISRTFYSGSYSQKLNNPTETQEVTYSCDFTELSETVEFIAYVNGHKHVDMIGYLNGTTNLQLTLNVTHGASSLAYESAGDYPRATGKGSVQDAFNVYVIDRSNKAVKVIRIGSTTLYDMNKRDFMTIPYKAIS